MSHGIAASQRWLALYILCLGVLMIVLDTTIVNVALPSIREDLQLHRDLAGVGGQCLPADLRRLPAAGRQAGRPVRAPAHLPRWASPCSRWRRRPAALANTQGLLMAARAVQGLGGAVVSAVALSLIMNVFTEAGERAKAMGIYGFVCSGGGSIGVLLGGLLTSSLSWHWIFLGQRAHRRRGLRACAVQLLPAGRGVADAPRLDVAGARHRDRVADAGGVRHRQRQRGGLDSLRHACGSWARRWCCWSPSS